MMINPYHQRIDEQVHCAEPVQLVSLLHRALGEKITSARDAIRAGQIQQRSAQVSQAIAIVGELAQSLDPQVDPLLAARLCQLYDYLIDRLLLANSQQIEAPLDDALRVATVLAEAWRGIDSARLSGCPHPGEGPAHLSLCG
ncbi:MAG TPA: flagellar export chaperone FliS [Bryobacteraceae bacterium]|nr:flagellar export chaperone FliS [Bryobacterales bacterium]HRJ18033.1 flagellar export chaperone FliS [Bryobacteraceae bacterium]